MCEIVVLIKPDSCNKVTKSHKESSYLLHLKNVYNLFQRFLKKNVQLNTAIIESMLLVKMIV